MEWYRSVTTMKSLRVLAVATVVATTVSTITTAAAPAPLVAAPHNAAMMLKKLTSQWLSGSPARHYNLDCTGRETKEISC